MTTPSAPSAAQQGRVDEAAWAADPAPDPKPDPTQDPGVVFDWSIPGQE
jgi:hypothetical protein